ncbi:MAG TPA: hypothetical protein VHO68_03170 [Bacteroidales bacterium]|nr:hypothetical protein [Bacteroidales bacterium]
MYRQVFGVRNTKNFEQTTGEVNGRIVPPFVTHDWNPVGSYKRFFNVPSDWNGKEIFLHFGAVSSAFYVWVNETLVGYSEDSKMPAEFNITKYLKKGKNSLACRNTERWIPLNLQKSWSSR